MNSIISYTYNCLIVVSQISSVHFCSLQINMLLPCCLIFNSHLFPSISSTLLIFDNCTFQGQTKFFACFQKPQEEQHTTSMQNIPSIVKHDTLKLRIVLDRLILYVLWVSRLCSFLCFLRFFHYLQFLKLFRVFDLSDPICSQEVYIFTFPRHLLWAIKSYWSQGFSGPQPLLSYAIGMLSHGIVAQRMFVNLPFLQMKCGYP